MPNQVTFSNGHTHLILLMEIPAIISFPLASLSSLWQEWRHFGSWIPKEINYQECDQVHGLAQASHLLRSGQTHLSSILMSEMQHAVRGRFLVRYLRAHKPTWYDKSLSESTGSKEPFVLTVLDMRIYSTVSNRFTRHTLHFTLDVDGAHFSIAGEYSSVCNVEPSELLGPMSRQGYFVGFQNHFPLASKTITVGSIGRIANAKLDIDLRKARSWDIDYYSGAISYVSKEDQCTVCYCRFDH